jgi:alanyl-tRNA synthetase
MGLERVAAVIQGKLSNYDTDLLHPIIERAAGMFPAARGDDATLDSALRIVADHSRAAEFLIHDGVVPSNDGRGYVLRKIMRRAMRHARRIGVHDPFLYQLTGFVAELMRPAYPELMESLERVARIVKDEEHRYATTFEVAERIFHDEAKGAAQGVLPGAVAFKLYDSYGLPLEEQEEMAREYGLAIDRDGFTAEMDKQRQRARASWKGGERAVIAPVYQELLAGARTKFLGYEKLEAPARVAGLIVGQQAVESIPAGQRAELVLDQTPFYAEAGGQVGDRGALYSLETGDKLAQVEDTYVPVPGLAVHRILSLAPLRLGDEMQARVDEGPRRSTMRNHTATHLLHAALRTVLGPHVKQAGSVVDPARLRFDFTHYAALDDAELAEVERLVNAQVLRDSSVVTDLMELDQALETGAMALFGEKYGDRVRVVSVPGFSRELCGGTHVGRTGEIGLAKITYEGSISAGVRRIEAVTGEGALERLRETMSALRQIASLVRAPEPELVEQVEKMLDHRRALERQIEQLKSKVAQAAGGGLERVKRQGVWVVRAVVPDMDRAQLRSLSDSERSKGADVVVLGTNTGEVVSAVRKDLSGKVHAGKLLQAIGVRGGGRPDLAEGRIQDPAALAAALDRVYDEVEKLL